MKDDSPAKAHAKELLEITQGDLGRIGLIYERLGAIQQVATAYLRAVEALTKIEGGWYPEIPEEDNEAIIVAMQDDARAALAGREKS